MTESNHLCDLWQHTTVKVFKHDPKSEVGLILKQWVILNKLENFNSVLNYNVDDFTPSGNLSCINGNGEILHITLMKGLFNLRWYIQHLIDENESGNESKNPLSHENWIKQANWKFIKYVIHHRHSMTPEQLKQRPFKESFKKQNEKLDTEEGESNEEEEESSTASEMSEYDSESYTPTEGEQEPNTTETHQVHSVLNNILHNEDNSSEPEDDSSEENSVNEIETYENNGEQNDVQDNKLLTTNLQVKLKTKVDGLITYSTDQQIFKFKVSSASNQEVWGVYTDFDSFFIVNGQLMPFYNIWVSM